MSDADNPNDQNELDGLHELTSEQFEELRATLRVLRDELQRLIAATREAVRPVELNEPIGRLTRMDAIQQQSMTTANRRSYDLRLQQVQQALTYMDRGRYGLCNRCEDPIGYQRLSARPESPYCIDCQDDIDRRHA